MRSSSIIPFYQPLDICFTRGHGVYLYDNKGKRYLDFCAGIAASSLGHCHPSLINALETQNRKLWHVSNMYRIPEAEKLAEKLVSCSFADMAFFGNSGAEAVECGFKIVRSYQNSNGRPERYKILTLRRAFHGRTYAACSANEPERFSPSLRPYVDWFESVHPDMALVEHALRRGDIGAVLVEPVQGEGGVHVLKSSFLNELRALCDQLDVLLFFDCVQCGAGRTGRFFAYEHSGIEPDVCTLAKGIGGGFPVGACLVTKKSGKFADVGMHGSTCGGNPLASTVAYTVVTEILKDGFLDNVTENGAYLGSQLNALAAKFPVIKEVRGLGLMWGLEISGLDENSAIASLAKLGLLVGRSVPGILRVVPPLIVTRQEIDEALEVLEHFFRDILLKA